MPQVFKARLSGPTAIFKVSAEDEDRFIIWGKASVEVVDKEGDKITAEALKNALPQLLRRKRLSVEHTDQLVGDIRDSFETDEPVTVEIDGKEYTRTEFPTDVLKLDDDEPPALFVAGEIYDDSRQAKQVREDIEDGKIDSYSISGEAISSSTKVKEGDVYDEITDLDLSAVTLCEEGMNQEAKFGTVVKMGDDSVSPRSGGTSEQGVVVMKAADSESMSKSDDGEPLNREELRGEFKSAAQEALKDADFPTTAEVKSIVDSRIEEKEENEYGPSNASEAAGDEEDDSESDEKADTPDPDDDEELDTVDEESIEDPDSDSEQEVEVTDEGEDDEDDAEKALEDAATQVIEANSDLNREDVVSELQNMIEAATGSDDEVVEGADDEEIVDEPDDDPLDDPDEGMADEVVEPDGSSGSDVLSELEAAGVPDDLCEAVSEYVEGGDDEAEDEVVEMEDDEDDEEDDDEDSTTEKQDPVEGPDLASAQTDDEYLSTVASGVVPPTEDDEDLMKSFEREDGPEVEENPGTLGAFYESVGEEAD